MSPDILHALETAAIVVAGALTGSELAVAVFFHPCISRLEDAVHIRAAQTLAKVLGMVMQFWYPLTFLLALALTLVAHATGSTPWWLALTSTVLLALISVYSVLLPVPINNQVARWQPDSVPANWRGLRRRWDLLHAIRVVFLVIALILLVASCVY
jgi:uncharacterized membrane protein